MGFVAMEFLEKGRPARKGSATYVGEVPIV